MKNLFNSIPVSALYFGIWGFYNNVCWMFVDKTVNFEEWWNYKFITFGLYTVSVICFKLEELIKK